MEHRIITGGEVWLPFARSRIKALRATGLVYASQHFIIGGYSVGVRIAPGHEYISLSSTSGGYEFFCADKWYVLDPLGDGQNSPGTLGAVNPLDSTSSLMNGCGVLASSGNGKPRFAMTLAPDAQAPKWQISDYVFLKLRGPSAPRRKGDFYTTYSWADQNFQQYHWWKDNKAQCLVTSTGATGRGRTWTSFMMKWYAQPCYAQQLNRGLANGYRWPGAPVFRMLTSSFAGIYRAAEDVQALGLLGTAGAPFRAHEGDGLWDIPPTRYASGTQLTGAHKRSEHANWRHAAVQTVTGSSGTTKADFMISTDAHGDFTVYRVADYYAKMRDGDIEDAANIPAHLVKVSRPDYPAWVTPRNISEPAAADHWQWAFNKDATKASTTPLAIADAYAYVCIKRTGDKFQVLSSGARSGASTGYWGFFGPTYDPDPELPHREVQRVRVYARKNGAEVDDSAWYPYPDGGANYDSPNAGTNSDFALLVDGKLVPFSLFSVQYDGTDTLYASDYPGLDPSGYEPAITTTPGFVAVRIDITFEDDPNVFEATATVTDSEAYADAKRFFMDTAYYIPTPRTAAKKDAEGNLVEPAHKTSEFEPDEDDLLTAEIEVFWRAGGTEYAGEMAVYQGATVPAAGEEGEKSPNDLRPPKYVRDWSTQPGNHAPALMDNYRDTPNMEGLLLGGYCGMHFFVYYTVRRRSDQKLVKRLCLAHDVDWQAFELNWRDHGRFRNWRVTSGVFTSHYKDESTPKTYFGMIEQAELRYLSFMTRSYSRKPNADTNMAGSYLPQRNVDHLTGLLRPRFELRVHGEALETADYSQPDVTGFGTAFGADPMTELNTPPDDAVRMPHTDDSSGITLAMLQWFAMNHIDITHNDCLSFSPRGDWAAYFDRRTVDMALQPASTSATGVFDTIYEHASKKKTSHKAAFNKAFDQTRDYSFYEFDKGDFGGFGATGIWLPAS